VFFIIFQLGRRTRYYESWCWLWIFWKFYLANPCWTISFYGRVKGKYFNL